jgi:RHS repeat-associated protein
VPFGLPAGDADSDGDVDAADLTQIQSWIDTSAYDVRGDFDLDGDVDATDKSLANAISGTTLGRGVLTRSTIGNRFGYAGYFYHQAVLKYHVRNRVYDPYMGRWTNRDPIEYTFTLNLYEYGYSMPLWFIDPLGLYGIRDYWEDFKDGLREVRDTWKEIFDDPSKYRQYAGDDEAIDQVQQALEVCECIPGAEQIVAPINIGLDLIQGDCAGAGQTLVCAAIPGPGGGGGPVKGVIPNKPIVVHPPLKRTPGRGLDPNKDHYFPDPGGGGTIRQVGPEGKACRDVDYGHDHGAGDPHIHDWDWDNPRPRRPGRPIEDKDRPIPQPPQSGGG